VGHDALLLSGLQVAFRISLILWQNKNLFAEVSSSSPINNQINNQSIVPCFMLTGFV
jgi:3-polyprenyl-4-hydroxybenzoate decarboxylase